MLTPPEAACAPAEAATTSRYTVSVRALCAFTARQGDLDRRFTPAATATEGLAGQAAVAARRGPHYRREVPLQAQVGALRVRGRADGHDTEHGVLEEVKTIRGPVEDLPVNRRLLHWAQLQTYGALMCRAQGLEELDLALVYVDAGTQAETVLRERCAAADLIATFEARCRSFMHWAEQEAAHRLARDAALLTLPFPRAQWRQGQRGLAEAVYRAASSGRTLLAQAPTGIGKTLGVLYPLLHALPRQRLDKLLVLTCKNTARGTALDALQPLREAAAGRALRVLALMAREQACEYPDRACHGDSCPLARGFYDRLAGARRDAVAEGWMDAPTQQRVARAHGVCPYHLGHELVAWADVVVADVHHAFDPHGALLAMAQAERWRVAATVDEAHNLVERVRAMYSGAVELAALRHAAASAPPALQPGYARLAGALERLATSQGEPYAAHPLVPVELAEPLQALAAQIGEHLRQNPLAHGPGLQVHFDVLALQHLVDRHGPHALFDIERPTAAGDASDPVQATASLRCVVPAPFMRPRLAACHSLVLFSATLGTPRYQGDLLGLPEDTAWLDVPSAFAPEHLQVRVARGLSTRWRHRGHSLRALVDLMARHCAAHPGNYLAFFSSFDYLEQAADLLAQRHPALPQWRQQRRMDGAAREAFLARFEAGAQGVGFAVLGGAFGEGVDLPGPRLIGAFIATLGLPPVTPVQAQMRERLDTLFGPDHGYADRLPGLQKVVQAAGRVLRTPQDRGWLWLLDQRYLQPEVRALLPAWWRMDDPAADASTARDAIDALR